MTTSKTYPIQKATLKKCLILMDSAWSILQRTSHKDDLMSYSSMWRMLDLLTNENGLELNRDEDGKHYLKEIGYFEIQIPLDKHGNPDKIIEQFKEALAKNTTTMVEE